MLVGLFLPLLGQKVVKVVPHQSFLCPDPRLMMAKDRCKSRPRNHRRQKHQRLQITEFSSSASSVISDSSSSSE
jgi:hypothetical protein